MEGASEFPARLFSEHSTRCLRKSLVTILLLWMIAALSGCAASAKLPADARLAFERKWQELGLTLHSDDQILQAWRGDLDRVSSELSMPNLELWCLEVQVELQLDPSVEANRVLWILVKPDEGSPWEASMLMTMSSLWAYEACGVIE